MSAIFGIININNSPVKQSDMLSMQKAMDCWGPDGQYIWIAENAGLGELHLANTPESEHERFPLTDLSGNLIFVAACRIDNRDELFRKLNIPYEKRITLQNGHYSPEHRQKVITDAELIFETYQKYGKDCIHHLLGDWSFAVWDKQKKELFLARDHYGVTSIYYSLIENTFYFSSSFKALNNLLEPYTNHNPYRIIQIICGKPGNGHETISKNIYSVPQGYFIELGSKVNLRKYWSVSDISVSVNDKNVIENFNFIFNESVSCRLRTNKKAASFLSSGLDSGSVVCIASQILQKNNSNLYTYTSIPKHKTITYKSRILNEGQLAAKIAEKFPNIKHNLVDTGELSPYSSIGYTLDKLGQPMVPIMNSYWLNNILFKAKEDNCNIILNSQFGNYTISWPSAIYISNRTPDEFLSPNLSIKDYIKSKLPPWLISTLIELGNRDGFLRHSLINKDVFSTYSKKEIFNNSYKKNLHNYSLKELQIKMLQPENNMAGAIMSELSKSTGMEMRDPTIDKRIIEFCLSVPDKYFVQNGTYRLLIKSAMSNVLPQEILNNTARGKQAADIHYRIKEDYEKFYYDINEFSKNSSCKKYINFTMTDTYLNNLSIEKNHITYKKDNAFLRAFQTCTYLTKTQNNKIH